MSWLRHGLGVVEHRPATTEEVAASHSTWAKWLNAATSRPVILLRLRALGDPADHHSPPTEVGYDPRG